MDHESTNLIVSSVSLAPSIVRKGSIDGVLSIEHPGALEKDKSPIFTIPQLTLTMWDSEVEIQNGPTKELAKQGLEFARGFVDKKLLVHCRQGKSRSAAYTLGVLVDRLGPGNEAEALKQLLEICPLAAPNLLIVTYADELLGCNGKLIEVVLNHPEVTARREKANESRRRWVESNPHLFRNLI